MLRQQLNIKNRKARFLYEVFDEYVAGIVLLGTEIKSIRAGKVSIDEAYCYIKTGELFVKNMHIANYKEASYNNEDEKRDRKLLLNKKELLKIQKETKIKGYTIVVLATFINSRGLVKLKIGIAKGKKIYDKRESIKKRESDKEIKRNFKLR